MEYRNIIIILSVIIIILAAGLAVEIFALNNNSEPTNTTNNTTSLTTNNTTAEHISSDAQNSGSSENSIESNRPKNDPNYKGYTPYHESEITKDGWNPHEHETYREKMADGTVKIHYDDGYFRLVDENGYVITYGYG